MDQQPKPLNPIEQYFFSVAAKKVSWAVGKFVAAFMGSVAVQAILKKYGVSVDPVVLQGSATAGILALLEWAHDYAKLKTGWVWL